MAPPLSNSPRLASLLLFAQAAKGSGGKKAKKGCVKAVPVPKSVPVSTWNAFDMLTGLDDTEDTESLSAMSDGTVGGALCLYLQYAACDLLLLSA